MFKFVVSSILIGAAVIGFFVWQHFAPVVSGILPPSDPGHYTISTVGARFKLPTGWEYSKYTNPDFTAFVSPDYQTADGTDDPFGSSPVVAGGVLLIPLFLFEEFTPLPVGVRVIWGERAGDIAKGSTAQPGSVTTEYYRIRLLENDARYVLIALEYPKGFLPEAKAIADEIAASVEFR